MEPSEHAQLATMLRRGAQQHRPLQIRLLGSQIEFLNRVEDDSAGQA